MNIRDADSPDIDEIFRLGNGKFSVSEKVVSFWPKKVLANAINSKTDLIIVAENNNRIIGFIIANYNPNFSKAIIENIFVVDEEGQNIAEQLLDFLINRLQQVGCEYVCALVESASSAINFYLENKFNRGIDCIWFDRILSKSFEKK